VEPNPVSFGDSISLNNASLCGYVISQTFDFEKPIFIIAYSIVLENFGGVGSVRFHSIQLC